MTDVKWTALTKLFADIMGAKIEAIDNNMKIYSKQLQVELSAKGLTLSGDLSMYDKACVEALITLSTSGITITAKAPDWVVEEDVLTITDGTIGFSVGIVSSKEKHETGAVATKKSTGWYGAFMVAGKFKYKDIVTLDVGLQIIRKPKGWGYVVFGQLEAEKDLSLHDIVDEIEKGGAFDLNLKKLHVMASSFDLEPDELPFETNGFPVKQGTSSVSFIILTPNIVRHQDSICAHIWTRCRSLIVTRSLRRQPRTTKPTFFWASKFPRAHPSWCTCLNHGRSTWDLVSRWDNSRSR